jgi:hypothetical protein
MTSWHLRMVVLAAFLLAALPAARAHEDTIIKLKGTKLVGLPEQYAPAEFDRETFRLRIGRHERILPPLLQGFFEEPHDLRFTASWYHDSQTLPLYIVIEIRPKNKDFHFELLLNLDTLELIETNVVLQLSKSTSQDLEIKMEADGKLKAPYAIRTLK